MPIRFEVFRICEAGKFATSMMIEVVSSFTSEFCPPMIPAKPTGFSESQISKSPGSKVLSTPSKVVIVSPLFAARTSRVLPATNLRHRHEEVDFVPA